jgi:hypothetical protein
LRGEHTDDRHDERVAHDRAQVIELADDLDTAGSSAVSSFLRASAVVTDPRRPSDRREAHLPGVTAQVRVAQGEHDTQLTLLLEERHQHCGGRSSGASVSAGEGRGREARPRLREVDEPIGRVEACPRSRVAGADVGRTRDRRSHPV